MERKAHHEGQSLIRRIVDEYRNLLEILEDPQILSKEKLGLVDFNIVNEQNDLTGSLSSIRKLADLFSKLKDCYHSCTKERGYEEKEDELSKVDSEFIGSDNQILLKDMQEKRNHLKRINGNIQQLIWDIDKMKTI